jgi:hypothetical protein
MLVLSQSIANIAVIFPGVAELRYDMAIERKI